MASLGVGANLFSNHIYYWGDIHRTATIGPDEARRMNAANTALNEGLVISLHSDHPVTPVNPLSRRGAPCTDARAAASSWETPSD